MTTQAAPGTAALTCPLEGLHLAPEKDAAMRAFTPWRRDETTGIIHIFDGKIVSDALRSPSFEVFNAGENYQRIIERTGIDLAAIGRVAARLPVFLNGREHKQARAKLAGLFARNKAAQEAAVREFVAEFQREKLVAGAEIDFREDLSLALFHAVNLPLLGDLPRDVFIDDDFPEIIEPNVGLKARMKIDKKLARALATEVEDVETFLVAFTLGHGPFVGSFALSLWHAVERHPGVALCDIPWPKTVPATSAPFFDRRALEPWRHGDLTVDTGARIRLHLEASAVYGPLPDADVQFGKGRHLCLGRAISLMAWRALVEMFAASPLIAEPLELQLRRPDPFLVNPLKARVRLRTVE